MILIKCQGSTPFCEQLYCESLIQNGVNENCE